MPTFTYNILTTSQLNRFYSSIKTLKMILEKDQDKFKTVIFDATWNKTVEKVNLKISLLNTKFTQTKTHFAHDTFKGEVINTQEDLHNCFLLLKEIFQIIMEEVMVRDATPSHLISFVNEFIKLTQLYFDLIETQYKEYKSPSRLIKDATVERINAAHEAIIDGLNIAKKNRQEYEKDIYVLPKLYQKINQLLTRPDIQQLPVNEVAKSIECTIQEARSIKIRPEILKPIVINVVNLDEHEIKGVTHYVKMFEDALGLNFCEAVKSIQQRSTSIYFSRLYHWRDMYKKHILPLKQQLISGEVYDCDLLQATSKGEAIMADMACDYALTVEFCTVYVDLVDAFVKETQEMISAISTMELQLRNLREEQNREAVRCSEKTRIFDNLTKLEVIKIHSYSRITVPVWDIYTIVTSVERLTQFPTSEVLLRHLMGLVLEAEQYKERHDALTEMDVRQLTRRVNQSESKHVETISDAKDQKRIDVADIRTSFQSARNVGLYSHGRNQLSQISRVSSATQPPVFKSS